MSNNTQSLSTEKEKPTLKSLLNAENMRRQFAAALPKHLTPDRFCRVATTALMRVHNLANCTQESFMKCLLDLSAWGIEPDGRRAHLIPFKRRTKNKQTGQWEEVLECTLILDWKGLAELALRSGMIAKLHADLVCENDEFEFDMGEILHHRINFRQPRGEPYAAYAMAETKDGAKFVQVMTKDEIEGIRNNSQGWKAFKEGFAKQSPWNDSPGEMWKKTAFRRLAKWLPLSAEFRDATDTENDVQDVETIRDVGPKTSKPKFLSGGKSEPDPSFGEPEPESDPEAPTVTEPPSSITESAQDTLIRLMNENEIGEEEFMAYMVQIGLAKKNQGMSDLAASKFETALKGWDALLEALRPKA